MEMDRFCAKVEIKLSDDLFGLCARKRLRFRSGFALVSFLFDGRNMNGKFIGFCI